MQNKRRFSIYASLWTLCVCIFACPEALAVEVTGKVLAISPDGDWVTIERTADGAAKPATLDIKKGTSLVNIEVGKIVVVEFDPEAEAVTEVRGKAIAPQDADKSERLIRIRFTFEIDGVTKTTIEEVPVGDKPLEDSKEEVRPAVWRINHLFTEADKLQAIKGPLAMIDGVTFDAEKQSLHIRPNADRRKDATALQYPTRFKLPLIVEADLAYLGEEVRIQISPNCQSIPNLHPFIEIRTVNGFETSEITHQWVVGRRPPSGDPIIQQVARESGNVGGERRVNAYAKPPIKISPEEIYLFRIGAFSQGTQEGGILLKRLSVEGRFIPTLGLALAPAGGNIVVENVMPQSPAKEAGLKKGDQIISIEGKRPTSVARTVQLLGMTQFGESWTLKARRGNVVEVYEIQAE